MTLLIFSGRTNAQKIIQNDRTPFDGIDQTWQNGSDRRDSSLFRKMKYFTPSIMMDVNYTYSFNDPIDNTVVGSTALARDKEIQLSALNIGGDFSFMGARARFMTQFGTRSIVVPRNDLSPYRGQFQLADVYRYLSEAYVGYHFDKMDGINIDAGLFMSYIGLNSYYQPENWEYQASYTSDNTPWFFNGIRLQLFPSNFLKIEGWIINGWQSYGSFNSMPGVGFNITWMPNSHFKLLTNDYYGTDAADMPGRKRVHSDNSVLVRYFYRPWRWHRRPSPRAFRLRCASVPCRGSGNKSPRPSDENAPACSRPRAAAPRPGFDGGWRNCDARAVRGFPSRPW